MKSWTSRIFAALGVVLVSASVFVLATGATFHGQPAGAQTSQTLVDENTITAIYSAASPAVVEIDVTSTGTGLRGGFSQGGQGSGFVIDNTGNIVTNNHVIDGATSVQIIFSDGKTASATVLGRDAADDLAVVKVDAAAVNGIKPLVLADSAGVKPGQLAIAIGSPYGLNNSIAVGVISGLNRRVDGSSLTGMIQTDANIQPGNSGGPLLNSTGQVIGINTAFEGQGTGIGFAVPSSVVNRALADLKAGKEITRPWIGISGLELTQTLADNLSLSVNQGVYVVTVVPGAPAEKAGLKAGGTDQNGAPGKGGDVITAVGGTPVKNVTDIQNYLATKKVGDTITLTILRGGASTSASVTLGARPADTSTTPIQPVPTMPAFPWRNR